MLTMALVIVGLIGIGMIGAGLVLLHHFLKAKEEKAKLEGLKTTVIPELEKMTMDMLTKTMEIVPDMTIDMTKKFFKIQKELEEEMY